jgi:hypothetical protein
MNKNPMEGPKLNDFKIGKQILWKRRNKGTKIVIISLKYKKLRLII